LNEQKDFKLEAVFGCFLIDNVGNYQRMRSIPLVLKL